MRRAVVSGLVCALASVGLGGAGAPAAGADVVLRDPGTRTGAPVLSDNVAYHGTIPLDSPGVGGEVVRREDLDKTFFYVTGAKGLSIYDVTIPALPVLAGHLPFPHLQNEDLKVSDDGKTAVIAADGSFLVSAMPLTVGITVIDVTNPALPRVVASNNDRVMGRGLAAGVGEHTAECADANCSVIYGRTGRIYKVDAGRVDEIGRWNHWPEIPEDDGGPNIGGSHALNRDEAGLIISDSNPRLVLDPGVITPGATPEAPALLAWGRRASEDSRLQHNNVRTDATGWVPRNPGDPADDVQTAVAGVDFEVNARAISVESERPVMRAGELFLGNSESNINPTCSAAGGLSIWSMVNFDRGDVTELRQLEVFRPLNGTLIDGSPPANPGLGCSGHWFTENDGVVAASWYEHGVRFFEIDKTVGTIAEVGWFQPVATEAGAAYWIDDTFVYSVDYARGIDILSFGRDLPVPSQQELDASWLVNLGRVGSFAAAERFSCNLAGRS